MVNGYTRAFAGGNETQLCALSTGAGKLDCANFKKALKAIGKSGLKHPGSSFVIDAYNKAGSVTPSDLSAAHPPSITDVRVTGTTATVTTSRPKLLVTLKHTPQGWRVTSIG